MGCHVTFVCDDEKVTSDTSDGSKVILEIEKAMNTHEIVTCKSNKVDCDEIILFEATETESFLLYRFVPEFSDSNKITMV